MSKWSRPKNDGGVDVDYHLVDDENRNPRLSEVLNEAIWRHGVETHIEKLARHNAITEVLIPDYGHVDCD